ncbi:hypothetical protein [Herbidospora cretacea]|uniref:hypothetical protein n=1 Tax=Herbidospora cretacea TaxID=28444 RepID=UPI000772FF74|nr:hypothetical protein [Herbidospora cretacea]
MTERSYLKFDTSVLAGKTITDAKLEAWNNDGYGCGDSAELGVSDELSLPELQARCLALGRGSADP